MSRERQVSKLMESVKATVLTYNLKTNVLEYIPMVIRETDAQKVSRQAEKNLAGSKERKFITVTHQETVSEYRAMREETFLENSTTEKPSGDYISRTIKSVKASVLVYDLEENGLKTITVMVTGDTDEKTILRKAEKQEEKVKVITIQEKTETEELRYMTEAKFLELSQKVEKGQSRL